MSITDHATTRHSSLDDAQGIFFGSGMAAFSMVLLTHLGLVTGQTAGLAVLISYATGYDFGPVFFLINIPFYWFAFKRMGLKFVAKTFIAVALVSGLSVVLPDLVHFDAVNPFVGAILFGCISGTALIALFRHGASLGGIGILALYLQDTIGLRAGIFQLMFDVVVFTLALFVRDWQTVAISALGALVVNLVITMNHRRDRYIAT
ncbi:MAG: YitT family protein [Rhodobacteraceae bacterium]|nr:YitT family protein [Paracoccaceae bacterium]